VQILKRKLKSAIWRFKNFSYRAFHATIKFTVEVVTERYWLLDYLPTFHKKRTGVLLIRLDLIGDFVLWLDSAQAYRRLYPNKKITLAVNSTCSDLASSLPHWDEVISINVHELRTNYLYRAWTLTKLRWSNFAIAIQPTFSREFVGDLFTRACFAPDRIGYNGDSNNISEHLKTTTDRWYTKLVVTNTNYLMELNINAHFVRELGCNDFLSSLPVIPHTATLKSELIFEKPYVVIAPGASWQPKRWPIQHFHELICQINQQFDVQFVLCGGKDDQMLCAGLAQNLNMKNLTNTAGLTTLTELVEIIRHAALVVTNDSSPTHIAAATDTPSVCILGGGHFGRFLPYHIESNASSVMPIALTYPMECFGCNWQCRYLGELITTVPCISDVFVSEALRHSTNLLTKKIEPTA
jgi:ADP-heptose:LPS heptosyltransferase